MMTRVDEVATSLQNAMTLLVRRQRQVADAGDLSAPERSALARLEAEGAVTSAALARAEKITPQSMGATISGLEARGLVARSPDPTDGRRILLSISELGSKLLGSHRDSRVEWLSAAMGVLDQTELDDVMRAAKIMERLALTLGP